MDVSLQGYKDGMDVFHAGKRVANGLNAISAFLRKYDTAKIIFILDTHCRDNGHFVYKGTDPQSYEACSLLEVSGIAASHSPMADQPTHRFSRTAAHPTSSNTSPMHQIHLLTCTGHLF